VHTPAERWSVLADGGHVSRAAVTRFHKLIAHLPGYAGHRWFVV
jgi:hypothetical protein